MKSSYRLIAEANDFLDILDNDTAIINKEENMEKLLAMKTEMEKLGFNASYLPTISLRTLSKELDRDIIEDIKKHISLFRYESYLKKMTLRRIKVAIAAHRIFDSMLDPKVKKYLPANGNYVSQLLHLPYSALQLYYSVKNWLKGRQEPYIIVSIEYYKKAVGKQRASFKLYNIKRDVGYIEEKVKRDYGSDARVVSTRVVRPRGLVTNAAVRTAIASAVTRLAYEEALKHLPKRSTLLAEYNKILKDSGFVEDTIISGEKRFEPVISKMLEKGFIREVHKEHSIQNPFEECIGEFVVEHKILNELTKRNSVLRTVATGIACRYISLPLLRFYVLNNASQRERILCMPSLSINPNVDQLDVLDMYGMSFGIKGLATAVVEKFNEEGKCKIDPAIFGSCYLVLRYYCAHDERKDRISDDGKIINKIARLLDIEPSLIKKNLTVVKGLLEGRGSEFLGLLNCS